MQSVINVVLPVFAIIAAGFVCGHRGLFGQEASKALHQFVYWVALPALLFKAMAQVQLEQVANLPFLGGFLGAIILIWAVTITTARLVFKLNLAQATLHGMNGVYGNSGYMGIPLAMTAFGNAAALPAIIVTVVNTAVLVGIAIALIESGQRNGKSSPALATHVVKAMARNPMIVAPLAGLAYASTHAPMPEALTTFTTILGGAAGPCALFSIGLFMVGKPQSDGYSEVAAMTVTKLLIHPLVTAAFVLLIFNIDPLWAKVAILMAALPTGTGSFVLAQTYGLYVLRTSSATLVTTVLSAVTISVFFLMFPPGP